ncbi:MAG: hypothetical protein QJR07_07490 [Acetobacteraceae bacterium]|nr:hypothetical protein [Acetobacteraceae bacterium]
MPHGGAAMWIMVSGPYTADGSEAAFEEITMPLSLALTEGCDACLRIGGPSQGADVEAARFRALGRPVWHRPEDMPAARG